MDHPKKNHTQTCMIFTLVVINHNQNNGSQDLIQRLWKHTLNKIILLQENFSESTLTTWIVF